MSMFSRTRATSAWSFRRWGALALTAAVGLGLVSPSAQAAEAPIPAENLTFTWAVNQESGAGAFNGSCNFLSAGIAGNAGGSGMWVESAGLFRSVDGNTRIEKPDTSGNFAPTTWANKCTAPNGTPVAFTSNVTGNRVVIDNGTGTLNPGSNSASVGWTGSFTVVLYGGFTYFTLSNPTLTVTNGVGTVTATMTSFASSMDDNSLWEPLPAATVTLANLSGVTVTNSGFTVTPDYVGVSYTASAGGTAQVAQTGSNAGYWGAFPSSFIDYLGPTGQAAYWYSTGLNDEKKPAAPLTVSVSQPSSTTLTTSTTEAPAGSTVTASVSVTSSGTVGNGPVQIFAGTKLVGTATLSGGTGTATLTLPAGVNTLTAAYPGRTGTSGSRSAQVPVSLYFTDKVPGSGFYDDVMWLASSGITTGQTPTTYAPVAPVSRQAMAAFLFRLYKLSHPDEQKPTCTTDPFTDVKKTSTFCGEILWLSNKGVTTGQDGKFKPADNVSRQAMAAFLFRLFKLDNPGEVKPTCTTDPFTDVKKNSTFCGEILWLSTKGITTGSNGLFKPVDNVSRQAMAAFLHRLALLN